MHPEPYPNDPTKKNEQPSWDELLRESAELERKKEAIDEVEKNRQNELEQIASSITPEKERWHSSFSDFMHALASAGHIDIDYADGHHLMSKKLALKYDNTRLHFSDPESAVLEKPRDRVDVSIMLCRRDVCHPWTHRRNRIFDEGLLSAMFTSSPSFRNCRRSSDWEVRYITYREASRFDDEPYGTWKQGSSDLIFRGKLSDPGGCIVSDDLGKEALDRAFRKTRLALADFARKHGFRIG